MKKLIVFCGISFVAGALVSYLVFSIIQTSGAVSGLADLHPIRLNNSSYKYVNPLLAYVIPSADQEPGWAELKSKITKVADDAPKQGVEKVSVFLSTPNEGRWIGVNEDELYPPASMFKVVIMIAYLRGEQENPGLLNKNLTYTAEDDKITLNGLTTLKVGESYAINELINKMIIDSDNGAETALLFNVDQNFFHSLFATLGIPGLEDGQFQVSPRQYSLFFRIIYNATFLNPELSEKALGILAQTTYENGLIAGVPKNVTVAHKFGQYTNPKDSHDLELHDCGIVYIPQKNPYFLCVMTKGNNLAASAFIIKDISQLVYDNFK